MADYLVVKENCKNDAKECRVLGGIDTLYSFIKLSDIEVYRKIWASVNVASPVLKNYEFLNFTGKSFGFVGAFFRRYHSEFKDLALYRIGFKNPDKQKNVHNIYVQLEAAAIYSLGLTVLIDFIKDDISRLFLSFDSNCNISITDDDFIVSRCDFNSFVDNFDFSQITAEMFISRFRSSSEINNEMCVSYSNVSLDDEDKGYEYRNYRGIETLYLGGRSSPVRFKIYDKKLEIDKNRNSISSFIKREFLKNAGFKSEHIWNVEFTVKREVLKEYRVNTLSDLKVYANGIFKDLMARCSFVGFDLELIERHKKNNNSRRLKSHDIWNKISDEYNCFDIFVDVERVYKSYKTNSKLASIEKIKREIVRQIENEQPFNSSEFMNIYNEASRPPTYKRLRI